MHLEVDQKYYLWQEEEDGLVLPVLDSLDNYKMLSERMNVLTIYLPCRKLPVASNLRIVKTAVSSKSEIMHMHTTVREISHTVLAIFGKNSFTQNMFENPPSFARSQGGSSTSTQPISATDSWECSQ